ncbi:tetratricopeptide repeat protein [Peribacillus butanolivorans]|uniref:tetratricopeptide repeat protein n=1 Tax=Peribacillus butanolivorans TaxID=421767 RepID=UPI00364A5454
MKKVIQYDPSSTFSYNLLGEIYTKNHDYEEAIEVLLKTISIQLTLENLNNLGVCYYKNKEYFHR